ncbi:DUF3558 family protein [Embleya sp. NPDC127516]|uniref:DUF3558 family protein n=1 Tax=Embleya sp. NPDC127516 TaxID=3363990 RepID=UPI003813500F
MGGNHLTHEDAERFERRQDHEVGRSAATPAGLDYCAIPSAASLGPLGHQPGDGKPDTMSNLYDGGCKYDNRSTRVAMVVDIDTITLDTSNCRTFDVSGFPNVASFGTATSCGLDVQVGKDLLHMGGELLRDTPAVNGKLCDLAVHFAEQVVAATTRT